MANRIVDLYVGRKGILFGRRENGKTVRFGVRIRDRALMVWDGEREEWIPVPQEILSGERYDYRDDA